jgi:hypothetical protein
VNTISAIVIQFSIQVVAMGSCKKLFPLHVGGDLDDLKLPCWEMKPVELCDLILSLFCVGTMK